MIERTYIRNIFCIKWPMYCFHGFFFFFGYTLQFCKLIAFKYTQSRAAIILSPRKVYNFHLLPTLKPCLNIMLHGLLWAPKIFAPGAQVPTPPLQHGSEYTHKS